MGIYLVEGNAGAFCEQVNLAGVVARSALLFDMRSHTEQVILFMFLLSM